MSNRFAIGTIVAGYREIRDGKRYERYFSKPNDQDRVIIEDGEVDQTVDLMKRVVWKYIDDTKKIARYLNDDTLAHICEGIWKFLYFHIQYKLDEKGLEQLRRPNRSWAERKTGIDCDCFSIFVSSILTNLKIPHSFRITKYSKNVFQHVYVIVPIPGISNYYTIDCVVGDFNYEKPFTEKKDFPMNLNGINVAVLSGAESNDVIDLVSGIDDTLLLGPENTSRHLETLYEHLVNTRNMIASKPRLISNVDYPPAFLKMLDYAIENWNTPNRDKALAILAMNEDVLNDSNGVTGTADDPETDGIDETYEELLGLGAAGAKVKGFFKKVGEAVKKGGKAFIRFNPLTISARAGFLIAMKLNLKGMASKLKWGFGTKEQAAAKGISATQWEKSKNALDKIKKLFVDKLQGKESALKNAILKGKAGGLSGIDEETDINGLGIIAAATLAAAVPVIAATLKILVDSGVMKSEDAQNIEAEVNAKSSEAEKMADSPDIKNSGIETDPGSSSGNSTAPGSSDTDSSNSKGIIGFVKKQPLIAAGGAALGIWGISKLLSGRKHKSGSALSGVSRHKSKKHKTHRKKSKHKVSAITLK